MHHIDVASKSLKQCLVSCNCEASSIVHLACGCTAVIGLQLAGEHRKIHTVIFFGNLAASQHANCSGARTTEPTSDKGLSRITCKHSWKACW